MKRPLLLSLSILCLVFVLQACVAVAVIGVAGGTAAIVSHDRRSAGAFVDDATIELKLRTAIREDKLLRGKIHVSIVSINGSVLVSGETPTRKLYDRVIDHARNTRGVKRVHNALTIEPQSSLANRGIDTWITGKIKARMLTDNSFDSTRIKVITENSVVYLMGLVTKNEAGKATEIARNTTRVKRVVRLFELTD
jgi:osmotically-inducible protein OsmY